MVVLCLIKNSYYFPWFENVCTSIILSSTGGCLWLYRATCCLQQQHTHKNRSGARNRFTFCFSLGILVCNAYMCTYIYKPHSVLYTNVGVLMILTPSHRWWWSLCLWSSAIHLPLESTKASWGSSSLPPTRKGKGRTESVRKRKRYYLFLVSVWF